MATKRGRREGRHAGSVVREELGGGVFFRRWGIKMMRDLEVPEGEKGRERKGKDHLIRYQC